MTEYNDPKEDDLLYTFTGIERADLQKTLRALRPYVAWTLLVCGLLVTLYAAPLGISLASRSGAWSADEAREAAMSVRFVGLMLFAGGLLERALLRFSR